jgi:hypothetical protein
VTFKNTDDCLTAGLPCDVADVRACNAKISKIAIGAQPEFVQILTVLAPFLDAIAKAHLVFPLFMVALPGK